LARGRLWLPLDSNRAAAIAHTRPTEQCGAFGGRFCAGDKVIASGQRITRKEVIQRRVGPTVGNDRCDASELTVLRFNPPEAGGFDGRDGDRYGWGRADTLVLAYACTIHQRKPGQRNYPSRGDPPAHPSTTRLLQRKFWCTPSITSGKQLGGCWLGARRKHWANAVKKPLSRRRYTTRLGGSGCG